MTHKAKCIAWAVSAFVIISGWVFAEWRKWDSQEEFKHQVRSFMLEGERFTVDHGVVLCNEINRIDLRTEKGADVFREPIDCGNILNKK